MKLLFFFLLGFDLSWLTSLQFIKYHVAGFYKPTIPHYLAWQKVYHWHPKKFTWHGKRFTWHAKRFTTGMPKRLPRACQKVYHWHPKMFTWHGKRFWHEIWQSKAEDVLTAAGRMSKAEIEVLDIKHASE
jgi:hypothetical protein